MHWQPLQKHDNAEAELKFRISVTSPAAAGWLGHVALTDCGRSPCHGAIADFSEVIRLSPTWISGYIKRGYAYPANKDFERDKRA